MKLILGLDFGGTKLAAGLVDPQSGRVLESVCCPTPQPSSARASLAAMVSLARALLTKHRAQGIGVCFDGPVEADGRTARFSMHIPGWEGFALADTLEKELQISAVIANDADAAALGEYRFGAGKGVRHMLYFTVSTGIGGGVIIDGKLHRGERAWAGEVGHMTLDPDGPPCPCGRNGCLESLASGLSVARVARERLRHPAPKPLPKQYKKSLLQRIPRNEITAKDVADAALQEDAIAQDVWNEAMRWLGIGIAAAANVVNPGRVVLGGGLTKAGDLLFDPVRRTVAQRALDPAIEIVRAKFGDDVGIVGAAALIR